MTRDLALSTVLRELLTTSIRSLEEVDLLLCLHARRDACTALELAAALHLGEEAAVTGLQDLVLARLVVQEGHSSPLRYVFAPTRAELRDAVDELARIYEECRLDILLLISSEALERVRSGARRAFSDPSRPPDGNKRK